MSLNPSQRSGLPLLVALVGLMALALDVPRPASSQSIIDIFKSSNQVAENIVSEPRADAYDFVIVGAGSGGSALANRLSENSEWRVLLMEAGGNEGVLNQIPVLVSFFQLTDYNWGYKVEPQTRACLGMKNRQCPWPRGKCLGGTSTLNYMIHTRGNRLDYDIWAALGNEGWSYEDVLPYFKRSERFKVPGERASLPTILCNARHPGPRLAIHPSLFIPRYSSLARAHSKRFRCNSFL
jgi:choline dehydrogenase-like flavoprotein